MLQFDKSVEQALDRINNATRTCAIFLSLGDHEGNGNFKVVEYSHDYVDVFTDTTPFPGYAPSPPQHPIIPNVAYVDKGLQPSTDPCLGTLLQKYHGTIDAQTLINVTALSQTGDMHAVIYDYANNKIYVSVATPTVAFPEPNPNPVVPAYQRQFTLLDMDTLFNMPK